MRVDDNLSIRDVGTTGDEPQTGVVRYLLDQAFNSFKPVESQVKIRRDANNWQEIFRAIPGFYLEGEEYRRPHYWTIWRWDRERAREAARQAQRPPNQQQAQRPRPPQPPPPPQQGGRPQGAGLPDRGPRPFGPRPGPRPGGAAGPPQRGPRPTGPGGPPQGGSRPASPGGPARPPSPRSGRPPRRPSRPANPR